MFKESIMMYYTIIKLGYKVKTMKNYWRKDQSTVNVLSFAINEEKSRTVNVTKILKGSCNKSWRWETDVLQSEQINEVLHAIDVYESE